MAASSFLEDIKEKLTWSNICTGTACALAAHMLQIGFWAYLSPQSLCKAFGLRLDGKHFTEVKGKSLGAARGTREKDGQSESFWPLLFGCREVGFGFLILIFAWLGERKAVGLVVGVVAALLATTDGVAAGLYGKGGWPDAVKSHGMPSVLLGVVSYSLLRD